MVRRNATHTVDKVHFRHPARNGTCGCGKLRADQSILTCSCGEQIEAPTDELPVLLAMHRKAVGASDSSNSVYGPKTEGWAKYYTLPPG